MLKYKNDNIDYRSFRCTMYVLISILSINRFMRIIASVIKLSVDQLIRFIKRLVFRYVLYCDILCFILCFIIITIFFLRIVNNFFINLKIFCIYFNNINIFNNNNYMD